MARPKGAKGARTVEFEALYAKYSEKYGDPLETLFRLTGRNQKASIKLQAAATLLPFKYAKVVAAPDDEEPQGELVLVYPVSTMWTN